MIVVKKYRFLSKNERLKALILIVWVRFVVGQLRLEWGYDILNFFCWGSSIDLWDADRNGIPTGQRIWLTIRVKHLYCWNYQLLQRMISICCCWKLYLFLFAKVLFVDDTVLHFKCVLFYVESVHFLELKLGNEKSKYGSMHRNKFSMCTFSYIFVFHLQFLTYSFLIFFTHAKRWLVSKNWIEYRIYNMTS